MKFEAKSQNATAKTFHFLSNFLTRTECVSFGELKTFKKRLI